MSPQPRTVAHTMQSIETSDGAGVRMRRSIGTQALDHFDPFLLLDHFSSDDASDYIGGFPDHPHRGFETVTYMLAGAMRHRDNAGNEGYLGPGSVQWMTAGRGIVHSEMPEQEEGLMSGFQLWVNLPAEHKMCAPRYQDIAPADVPEVVLDGGAVVRVLAGTVFGIEGPVRDVMVRPLYLDIRLPAGAGLSVPVTKGHNALVYVYDGATQVGGTPIGRHTLALMSDGDEVMLFSGQDGARLLLIAGEPIGEPVARYGPFVMNTREEIIQAVQDFQAGRF